MRIASGSSDKKLAFVAVDATDLKTRETGLTGFTVYRSRNGGTATAYTTPTVAELSAANMPGVYVLTIDEDTTITAGADEEEYVVHITHASMAPVTRAVEIFRPKITEGQTVTASGGSANAATQDVTAAAANKIADHTLRRTYANARASSDGDTFNFRSLMGAIAKLVNKWSISGTTLTVTHEDDTTSAGTQTLTATAGANPITAIDTD